MSGADGVLAALDIVGAEVDIAGHTYDVPPLSAAQWFALVLRPDVSLPLVATLSHEDQFEVMQALLLGLLEIDELVECTRALLEAMSGWRWWEADRLIRSSAASWRTIGGELARLGLDLRTIPLAAALNAIYAICCRSMDKDQRTKFDFELSSPPTSVDPDEVDLSGSEAAFVAALGLPPVMPPDSGSSTSTLTP